MRIPTASRLAAAIAALALAGCSHGSQDPLTGVGPNPPLPAPR